LTKKDNLQTWSHVKQVQCTNVPLDWIFSRFGDIMTHVKLGIPVDDVHVNSKCVFNFPSSLLLLPP